MGSRTQVRKKYTKVCFGYTHLEIIIKHLNGEIKKAGGA